MTTMNLVIQFWGPARTSVGASSIELTLERHEEMSVGALRKILKEKFPVMGSAQTAFRFAVNEESVIDDCRLADGDVVAIIPPVSGG